MNRLLVAYRRARRQVEYLLGYIDLDLDGNHVERRTEFRHCRRPLLLLYGFLATRQTLEVLERRLRRDGYGVFSLNLGGLAGAFNSRGIDDLAALVRTKVERLYARYPEMGPLTIVGHSMGGLIAEYYVKKLGGHLRTRAVVSLGTPHRGTPAAWAGLPLAPLARAGWQMRRGSPLIRGLREAPWPVGIRFTSMWSRGDAMTPYPAALLDTAGLPYVRNVEVSCTHREFLYKKRIYDVLLSELELGEQPAPVPLRRRPATSAPANEPAARAS